MGVPANNHVKAQVAELLRHLILGGVFLDLIFLTPVDEDHGGLCPVFLHALQNRLQLVIELIRVLLAEIIGLSLILDISKAVQGKAVPGNTVGPGIGNHAHLNAVDIHHGVPLFPGQLGAQRRQSRRPDGFDGADHAVTHGVTGMVVYGKQHVIACVLHAVSQAVRAIEGGISLVGVLVAAEGGLQVGNGIVVAADEILTVLENPGEIVAAALLAGGKHRLVHQKVSLGGDTGRSHHMLRLRGFRGRRNGSLRHGGGLRLRGLGGQHQGAVLTGLHIRFLVHQVNAQVNQEGSSRQHENDQNGEHHGQGPMAALGFLRHCVPPYRNASSR